MSVETDCDDMCLKRLLLLTALLLASGCLRPFTKRLDLTNQQIAETNAKLVEMSQKLDESNQKLSTFERAAKMLLPGVDKKK